MYRYGIITHRRIQNPANTVQKIRNPLKISAVNMTKSAVFCGFGLHLLKKSLMKNFFFYEVLNIQDGGGFSVNKNGCWVLNTSESLSETQSLSVSIISLRLNLSESFRYIFLSSYINASSVHVKIILLRILFSSNKIYCTL